MCNGDYKSYTFLEVSFFQFTPTSTWLSPLCSHCIYFNKCFSQLLCSPLTIPSLSSPSLYYSQFFHFIVFSLSQSHNTSFCKTLFSSYLIFFFFSPASIPSLLFFSLLVLACFKPNRKKKKNCHGRVCNCVHDRTAHPCVSNLGAPTHRITMVW